MQSDETRELLPSSPVRFTIDGEPFEFRPLPLGTLLLIERMEKELNINENTTEANPYLEWLLVTRRQTDAVRRIVALLTIQGNPTEIIRDRLAFLSKHCNVVDLCSLFIIGSMAQNRWLRDMTAEKSAMLKGISEQDLWDKPLVELLKDR